jgi:hypothetical protein
MCVYPQVSGLKDVNSFFGNLKNGGNYEGFWAGLKDDNTFFGNLKNGGNYEGFWAGLKDDNTLWMGSRNGVTFGRWDDNNPQVLGPKLEVNRYYVLAGRMGAGTGDVTIELFVDGTRPVASRPYPVNPQGNPSKMAIGQERDGRRAGPSAHVGSSADRQRVREDTVCLEEFLRFIRPMKPWMLPESTLMSG